MKQGASISGPEHCRDAVGLGGGRGARWGRHADHRGRRHGRRRAVEYSAAAARAGSLDRARGILIEEPVATEYEFVVRSSAASEVAVRSQVVTALQNPEFTVHSLEANDVADGIVEFTATVVALERNDAALEAAIADVIPVPEVTSVRWSAKELRGED